jgi:geranylgeranyl pyrophosphate synthase
MECPPHDFSLHAHDTAGTSLCAFVSTDGPFPSLFFVVTALGRAHACSLLGAAAPSALCAAVGTGALPIDEKLRPALLRVLGKGALPLPDEVAPPLSLRDEGGGVVSAEARSATGAGFSLRLCAPQDGALRAGVVTGSVTLPCGRVVTLAPAARGLLHAGCAGVRRRAAPGAFSAALLLEDGRALVLRGAGGDSGTEVVVQGGAGAPGPGACGLPAALPAPAAEGAPWASTRTFLSYPQALRFPCGGGDELTLTAAVGPSEVVSLACAPGAWAGRVAVAGALGGAPVSGWGTLVAQPAGAGTPQTFDAFFRAVGAATRAAVMREYPDEVSSEHALDMFALSPAHPWHLDGADLRILREGIVAPMRHLVDAGGKSWRAYGILAACDAVGGESWRHVHYLALAELLHVGSLVIDDVQDESPLRRGREAVHKKFGTAVAINSGTAAYFHCQRIIARDPDTHPAMRLAVLDQYFGCLRAGHAGQALDLAGLDHLMDTAIAKGSGATLEARLLSVHLLKTGVPAASLVRLGAVLGGGTPAQVEALGAYFESIGVAFQIMDDVRNLRGVFAGKGDKNAGAELKVLGEDITNVRTGRWSPRRKNTPLHTHLHRPSPTTHHLQGKVTFPVVKAVQRLPQAEMTALWATIKSRPSDRATVDGVISQLEACGAIEACVEHATRLVEEGFTHADPALPETQAKMMLQAFGSFLVELK